MRLFAFAPVVCCVLAAQAPAPNALTQAYNANAQAINQLLRSLQYQEALAKAEGLIPTEKPVFDGKDLNSLAGSSANHRALVAIYKACANAAAANGNWEKAAEYLQKGAEAAKENHETFKALATQKAQDAVDQIKAGRAQTQKQWDEIRPQWVAKLDECVKTKETLGAKAKRSKQEEATLAEVTGLIPRIEADIKLNDDKLKQFDAAVATNEKVLAQVGDMVQDLAKAQAKAEEDVTAMKEKIQVQQGEIEKFNADQLAKNKKNRKFKIEGNKNWVEAVVADKANFEGKPAVDQANLLNRLLVLAPGNPKAAAALENVKAGRNAFDPGKKPSRKGGR